MNTNKRNYLELNRPSRLSVKGGSTQQMIDEITANGCKEGSSLGCCGNYSGCCWVQHDLCFWHDLYCLCCSHWYCLWGCKKEKGCPSDEALMERAEDLPELLPVLPIVP